jgi:sulfur carrier protein
MCNIKIMSKIKITLNGAAREIPSGQSLSQLIADLGLDLGKIAIERNLEIINSDNYEIELVMAGDKIEIVHFIGGG